MISGSANCVSQVDGVSDIGPACCLCGSVGGGIRKGEMALCPPLCLGESCPLVLTLMPDPSVSPCMLLMPFKLLPWCWSSEGVSLRKPVYGFFKVNRLGLKKFLPPTQCPLSFAAGSYGDLSSWHWNPGLGSLVWDWDSTLPRCPSQVLSTTCRCGTRPF